MRTDHQAGSHAARPEAGDAGRTAHSAAPRPPQAAAPRTPRNRPVWPLAPSRRRQAVVAVRGRAGRLQGRAEPQASAAWLVSGAGRHVHGLPTTGAAAPRPGRRFPTHRRPRPAVVGSRWARRARDPRKERRWPAWYFQLVHGLSMAGAAAPRPGRRSLRYRRPRPEVVGRRWAQLAFGVAGLVAAACGRQAERAAPAGAGAEGRGARPKGARPGTGLDAQHQDPCRRSWPPPRHFCVGPTDAERSRLEHSLKCLKQQFPRCYKAELS